MSEDFIVPMRPAIIERDMLAHPSRNADGQYGLTVHQRGRVILRAFSDSYTADYVRTWSRGFLQLTQEAK